MEAKSIDKSQWPLGEWTNEPDREIFKTAEGFDAAILRHPSLGHLCGYVGVPKGHTLYGKSYNDADCEVHGGLTYSGQGQQEVGENAEAWYFGFDCAHLSDLSPGMLRFGAYGDSRYKNIAYVKRHVEKLSKQLAARGAA